MFGLSVAWQGDIIQSKVVQMQIAGGVGQLDLMKGEMADSSAVIRRGVDFGDFRLIRRNGLLSLTEHQPGEFDATPQQTGPRLLIGQGGIRPQSLTEAVDTFSSMTCPAWRADSHPTQARAATPATVTKTCFFTSWESCLF